MTSPASPFPEAVDLLVVGSGAAGFAAALAARAEGASVLLCERADVLGGTTAYSGGALWLPANPRLRGAGFEDSPGRALTYLKDLTAGAVDESVLRAYVETAPEVVDLLEAWTPLRFAACLRYPDYYPERPGGLPGGRTVEPEPVDGRRLGPDFARLRAPQSLTLMLGRVSLTAREAHGLVATGLRGMLAAGLRFSWWLLRPWRWRGGRDSRLALGNALIAGLWLGARARGVEIWTGARVTKLEAEAGRIAAALVEHGGRAWSVRVKHGVVLACGGYSRDDARKRALHGMPTSADWGASVDEDDGAALDLTEGLNADTDLLAAAWWMPVFQVPGEGYARAVVLERALPGAIVVGPDGRRFVNESAPYEDFVRAMRGRNLAPAWLILDDWHRRRFPLGPLLPGLFQPRHLWPRGLDGNWIHRADSPERLAEQISVDAVGLVETLQRFNADAVSGRDSLYGRGESAYDRYYADPAAGLNPCLHPLRTPPYYAVALWPGDLGSKGGLRTDADAQVLDRQGQPIAGLYAAGNAAANPLGDIYPGAGGTLGPAAVFGIRAARHALLARRRASAA